jgi:hypothetical protein
MYSKSLFNRNVNMERSMINPVGIPSGGSSYALSADVIRAIKAVQEFYTVHLANKTYSKIPTDYDKYLNLYNTVTTSYVKTMDLNLKMLFKITQEGLMGAMNAYGLNFTVTELTLQNTLLQKTIDDLISGVNVKPAIGKNKGNLSVKKTFTLAPLFSYYIMLYGMPAAGVGFDQGKLAVLLSILEKNNINPYK